MEGRVFHFSRRTAEALCLFPFRRDSSFQTTGGSADVADGIGEALVTTAVGLIVALLAVIPQSLFNRWSDEIELEIEEATADFLEFILTHH